MTDEELIEWLRKPYGDAMMERAADRIEALTKERDEQIEWVKRLADDLIAAEAKLAKAEAGLLAIAKRDEQMIWGEDYEVEEAFKDMRDIALATLAEIKGT